MGLIKKISALSGLTLFEFSLWLFSVIIISVSFLLCLDGNYLSLVASLVGATALIFVAKGYVIGQILTVVFAVLYGIISYSQNYYGEMITYLGMTSPIAVLTVISWLRHPFEKTKEVEVKNMEFKEIVFMILLSLSVTFVFYFILKAMGTSVLFVSTVSVTTSFLASYMTFRRNPFYAVGYMANDVVLIILWVIASLKNISYITVVICFCIFFINDLYGFINWQRMSKRQLDTELIP